MPDIYGPFDGVPWAQSQWYRDAYARAQSGVQGAPGATVADGDLPFTMSGLTVSIGVGRAHVRGASYERTSTPTSFVVTANTNATLSRRDRIVLRRDLAAKTVLPVRLQGTPASTPVAPALSQSENGSWDIPLFSFTVGPASSTVITSILDERSFLGTNGGMLMPMRAVTGAWSEPQGQFGANGALTSVLIPDPGFSYRLSAVAHAEMGNAPGVTGTRWDMVLRVVGSTNFDWDKNIAPIDATSFQRITTGVTNEILTGPCTVYVDGRRGYGTTGNGQILGNRRLDVWRWAA